MTEIRACQGNSERKRFFFSRLTSPSASAIVRAMREARILHTLNDLDDCRIGDVFEDAEGGHVITRIEPYDPTPVGYPGQKWCIVYSDRPGRRAWGITVACDKPLGGAK
jgi:hypothetical protein